MADPLQQLEEADRRITSLLRQLTRASQSRLPVTADDLASVLGELLRVGELLHQGKIDITDPHLADALGRYRNHLEGLQEHMPALHARLLTERARLEAQRSHLEAASAWAETSRSTT